MRNVKYRRTSKINARKEIMTGKKGFSTLLGLLIILIAAFIFFSPTLYLRYMAVFDKDRIIYETNVQRVKNGLPSLTKNEILNQMAEAKAKDMFAKQYFDHVSPDGYGLEDLARDYGYKYVEVGENLLEGNFNDEKQILNDWMNSPEHRHNILNEKFTEMGAAVIKGKYEGRTVWMAVQEFGVQ
ncbi:MAG: CAP domain-containing protein [Candidatus Staskawiczbacteria bacterium]|nr:CAP domain-containing protein [Candidatus Staskawiczbacteria bacterium]